MTQVDFYIVASSASDARERFACRLAEKAWHTGCRIFIHTESEFDAHRMNELLWTFRPDSFLPHGLPTEQGNERLPVLIGWGDKPNRPFDVLINLGRAVPAYFNMFSRVAEIVGAEQTTRNLARERYRVYRDQGCALRSHSV